MTHDINLIRLGSIGLFQTSSEAGEDWIADNLDGETTVESRFQEDIVYSAFSDGLTVAIDGRVIEHMEPA